jgi:hypothetical protein
MSNPIIPLGELQQDEFASRIELSEWNNAQSAFGLDCLKESGWNIGGNGRSGVIFLYYNSLKEDITLTAKVSKIPVDESKRISPGLPTQEQLANAIFTNYANKLDGVFKR